MLILQLKLGAKIKAVYHNYCVKTSSYCTNTGMIIGLICISHLVLYIFVYHLVLIFYFFLYMSVKWTKAILFISWAIVQVNILALTMTLSCVSRFILLLLFYLVFFAVVDLLRTCYQDASLFP